MGVLAANSLYLPPFLENCSLFSIGILLERLYPSRSLGYNLTDMRVQKASSLGDNSGCVSCSRGPCEAGRGRSPAQRHHGSATLESPPHKTPSLRIYFWGTQECYCEATELTRTLGQDSEGGLLPPPCKAKRFGSSPPSDVMRKVSRPDSCTPDPRRRVDLPQGGRHLQYSR